MAMTTGRAIAATPPGYPPQPARTVRAAAPRPVAHTTLTMSGAAPRGLYGVVVPGPDGGHVRVDLWWSTRSAAEEHARAEGLDASAVVPVRMTAVARPH